ncbi:hypothetical protein DAPPUDRAFT_252459 [Daphnia pulex]|uniref:Uncharacterized protein n=1 Tax=Daphnia pulex TaxID=6669 RepID=E9H2R1_DAPPU|nr:hypothetical protein DAPPUDRAFT_252621 [Daphnia pulex]EFX74015.1 hypothetical protein DAPPUDRAFT_252459 [Daphnia pulex]|eukprot:EFX73891.1 hypothetical protein DAPPUDRAFT_252621 [Daphnia pulex]
MDVEDDLDFRAPSLDFEILLKCEAKLDSIGKGVNDVEKVLYKSMLPVFPVLAFLESLDLEGKPGKANCMQLIENREVFNVLEHKNLFGASIIDKLLKSGRLPQKKKQKVVRIKKRSKFPVVVVDLKQIVLPKGSFAVG